jgi:hypothetical protein
MEHLKHSPDCEWAIYWEIVMAIEKQDRNLSQEHPLSERMAKARQATFANKWPHKGNDWKCDIKQVESK